MQRRTTPDIHLNHDCTLEFTRHWLSSPHPWRTRSARHREQNNDIKENVTLIFNKKIYILVGRESCYHEKINQLIEFKWKQRKKPLQNVFSVKIKIQKPTATVFGPSAGPASSSRKQHRKSHEFFSHCRTVKQHEGLSCVCPEHTTPQSRFWKYIFFFILSTHASPRTERGCVGVSSFDKRT